MNSFIKDKVRVTIANLKQLSELSAEPIKAWKYIPCDYKENNNLPMPDDTWADFGYDDILKGRDQHFWFYSKIKTPSVSKTEEVFMELSTGHEKEWPGTNPQGLIYLNGELAYGMDINHRTVVLKPDTEYEIHMYFHIGRRSEVSNLRAQIKVRDLRLQKLYYDMSVPYEAARCFPETDYAYIKTMRHLDKACNLLDFSQCYSLVGDKTNAAVTGVLATSEIAKDSSLYNEKFHKSVDKAIEYLKTEYFEKECGTSNAIVNYVGHTHIDVAWLWTLATTKEKAQHSFATVLALMDRYPEYIFMSSQPQLYEYLKEEAPELYEKVKERVREGRWEVEGAMWLEADCNLSSGESLIRQILYGKGFMQKEFGVDSKVLWLPDVFGYSAALPQILKKSGVDKFVTSKISWNENNKMPYDTFMWSGVDGTEIFTYFLTAQTLSQGEAPHTICTYNGLCTPRMNYGTWERYQQKDLNNETIVTFGYGDGGGGPTEEMLEMEQRLEYGLPGMPKAQMSRAGDFLNRVEERIKKAQENNERIPKWVGELYLEFHRGTYTSMARNKKHNRECEFMCQETEALSVADMLLNGGSYDSDTLFRSWKTLLLNQFHDIIPGSSILEVYEDSDKDYARVRSEVGALRSEKLSAIANAQSEKGILVYNPNSFTVSGYADFDGEKVYAENVPPMGWKVVEGTTVRDSVSVSDRRLENDIFIVLFDENYEISSIFDKAAGREVLSGAGNRLKVFEDFPKDYDNWEITNYYRDKSSVVDNIESATPIQGNGFGGFEIVRKYNRSEIKQRVILYTGSRRIDFESTVDWKESHILLKAFFPVDIHSSKATYEIQFGSVERTTHENTSWDAAQFEVCAQKWSDLSENGYGVSILNNCKYGHSVDRNEMSITLIKSGTYPNPHADREVHTFTYSLYPHEGTFAEGGTVNEAYLLNRPMTAISTNGGGKLPSEYSLINCDSENIVIETVKKAENGNGIIVRLYDAWNKKTKATVNLGFDAKKISLCDMMENPIEEIGKGNSAEVYVKNYEIVTLLIEA